MQSNATNDVGLAVETLLAATLHRLLEKQATPEENAKFRLAMRPEFATSEVESLLMGSCEMLHDCAEEIACRMLNRVLCPIDLTSEDD